MKARVKATGETIEIMQVYEKGESFYVRLDMLDTTEVRYHISELEFEGFETEGKFAETCLNGIKQGVDYIPDYWTRLEHQYAGMAMQGMLNNSLLINGLLKVNKSHEDIVAEVTGTAIRYAHALVEKLKEKEEK
jgi:hypothetical protein